MHLTRNCARSGFNLSEIMLAVMIIAMAFLPIIGVMGVSIKATSKDDAAIKAMNLCQEKLDSALQFPFGYYSLNLGEARTQTQLSTGILTLNLNDETIRGLSFRYVLCVTDRAGSFRVRERKLQAGQPEAPATWEFLDETQIPYNNLCHRYTMTVFWREAGEANEKFYSLVTFRADLKSHEG